MFRAVLLFVCVYVVLAAGDKELLKKCRNFNQSVMRCCNTLPYQRAKQSETTEKPDLTECYKYHTSSSTAYEADECIAKKLGFYGADGKIDFEVLSSFFESEFQSQELFGAIKENCLNADILNQESPGEGDFTKILMCVMKQMIEGCLEWSNEGSCNESQIKETTEVCKNIY